MNQVKSYKDLRVWTKSMEVCQTILKSEFITDSIDRDLERQMKRSAISIPSNIAEGWGRDSNKSFIYFLNISKGSLFELETQLILIETF